MQLNGPLLGELKFESENTRKMLERVPAELSSWKPHEKSMSLLAIAGHIADLSLWIDYTINRDELNLAGMDFNHKPCSTTEELLKDFDEKLEQGKAALVSASNENLMGSLKLKMGEHVIFDMPRIQVLRS